MAFAIKVTKRLARFWEKVNKDGPVPVFAPHLGPCWLWTAATNGDGYGRFHFEGRLVPAHRYAFEENGGVVEDGHMLDHRCRVHGCVRPSHLESVTNQENTLRGKRGRLVTHCPRGHEYDEKNTHRRPERGRRICRACDRERKREERAVA